MDEVKIRQQRSANDEMGKLGEEAVCQLMKAHCSEKEKCALKRLGDRDPNRDLHCSLCLATVEVKSHTFNSEHESIPYELNFRKDLKADWGISGPWKNRADIWVDYFYQVAHVSPRSDLVKLLDAKIAAGTLVPRQGGDKLAEPKQHAAILVDLPVSEIPFVVELQEQRNLDEMSPPEKAAISFAPPFCRK